MIATFGSADYFCWCLWWNDYLFRWSEYGWSYRWLKISSSKCLEGILPSVSTRSNMNDRRFELVHCTRDKVVASLLEEKWICNPDQQKTNSSHIFSFTHMAAVFQGNSWNVLSVSRNFLKVIARLNDFPIAWKKCSNCIYGRALEWTTLARHSNNVQTRWLLLTDYARVVLCDIAS